MSSPPDAGTAQRTAPSHARVRTAAQTVVTVRTATDSDQAAWDRYVDQHADGTFFHRYAWSQVLQNSLGYRPHYLLAERNGTLIGVLPLTHKKSALFGSALISLPFCTYGGPLGASPGVTAELAENAVALARDLNADHVELRGGVPADSAWLRRDDAYATFEKDLPPTPDAIVAAIPRKGRRHALRQSLRQGLVFDVHDDLTDFYAVLSESYRNLGTPIFPRSYFERLLGAFPGQCQIYVATHSSKPVSASLAFTYRDHLHPLYAGGTAAARALNANDFLFYGLMCAALEQGLTRFDFGRSKAGTGSFAYKKHWGYTPRFLTYGQRLVGGTSLSDLSPANPRYRFFVGAWKRLPLPASRALGPQIIRHLG